MKETLDVNPEYPSILSGDNEFIGLGIFYPPPGIGLVGLPMEVEDSAKVQHIAFFEVVGAIL